MSDTPRTDAATKIVWGQEGVMVGIEFARTLERELAKAQAEIMRLKFDLAEQCRLTDHYRKQASVLGLF